MKRGARPGKNGRLQEAEAYSGFLLFFVFVFVFSTVVPLGVSTVWSVVVVASPAPVVVVVSRVTVAPFSEPAVVDVVVLEVSAGAVVLGEVVVGDVVVDDWVSVVVVWACAAAAVRAIEATALARSLMVIINPLRNLNSWIAEHRLFEPRPGLQSHFFG